MSRRAYLYMRFSSAEQARGDSLDRQRTLAREYVARHPEKRLELVSDVEYVDEGVSSFAGQNLQPGRALHAFFEAVQDGRVAPGSVLMVESLDRLSRQQVIASQRLLLDLLLRDISVVTTSPAESREYDRQSGLHDLIISLAGMERANQESAIKSDRVRRAWKKKKAAAADKKVTKRAPAWLVLNPDRSGFDVIEEKAATVRRIFDLAESMGQHAIARVLNEEGLAPLMGKRSGWHASSVVKVLTSPAVIGTYQPHERHKQTGRRVPDGPAVPNYYPAIVGEALFYRTQALRAGRRATGAGRKGAGFTNLLTGIVKCQICGAPMVMVNKGKPPKGATYLVCSNARRGMGCVYHSVRYRHCELGFLGECQRVDVSPLLPGHQGKSVAAQLRKKQASIAGEVAQKKAVIQRMLSSIEENGGHIPRAVADQLAKYESRIDELNQEYEAVRSELSRVEIEKERATGLNSNMTELLILMRKSSDAERYSLRARFNDLLKLALNHISIGPADEQTRVEVQRLIDAEASRMVQIHPEMQKKAKEFGFELYPPLKGSITRMQVSYKNGNEAELIIDERGVVATRLLHAARAGQANADTNPHFGTMRLAIGYGHGASFEPKQPQPRAANGKFRRSTSGALSPD